MYIEVVNGSKFGTPNDVCDPPAAKSGGLGLAINDVILRHTHLEGGPGGQHGAYQAASVGWV
jgi:hypothetical protein